MALTDVQAVRLKTSDQPFLKREQWEADGETTEFRVETNSFLAVPEPRVWKNDALQQVGSDYALDAENGIITLLTLPAQGDIIVITYTGSVFSDEEVEHFLGEAGGNTTLAAALLLWAWAADAAKLAKKETVAGGGAMGAVTLDLAVRARELRESAKAFFEQWQKVEGEGAFAESITEIAWTPQQAERMVVERFLRRL